MLNVAVANIAKPSLSPISTFHLSPLSSILLFSEFEFLLCVTVESTENNTHLFTYTVYLKDYYISLRTDGLY